MINCTQTIRAIAVIPVFLAGCQSPAPTVSMPSNMTIAEAREIAEEFKVANYFAPPRTIEDLRAKFQDGRDIPQNCKEEWTKRQEKIVTAQEKLQAASGQKTVTYAANLVVLSESLISTGRFDQALTNITEAYNRVPENGYVVRKAIFSTQLTRLYARIGNLDRAEEQLEISYDWWVETRPQLGAQSSGEYVQLAGTMGGWLEKPTGRLYYNTARAATARLRGELPLAEYYFREAINNLGVQDKYSHINNNELRADLALTIMQQGRLMEAESEAREAIYLTGIGSSSADNYNGESAGPVAAMAAILLEQGKLKDAEYLARVAINMHEAGCSEPQSLGITEARRILIDALAEQGDWPGILDQVRQARLSLENYKALFNNLYGVSLAYIEAEINAGAAGLGRTLARRLKNDLLEEYGSGSYQVAEVDGILALVEAKKLHQYRSALNRFSRVMPILANQTGRNEIAVNSRRQRILQGYMDLLAKLIKHAEYQATGLDMPGELLRTASILDPGRVGQAISSAAARAKVSDPILARLIRQEQDLTEETRSLGNILAYIQSAPSATSRSVSITELKARLNNVLSARRTLEKEILGNYPDYAQLLASRPMAADEILKYLKPGQALLVFHVGAASTYAWAISPGTELIFADIDISREKLARKVAKLRQAVDPGSLNTLGDIPAFDVSLAHELYNSLLEPVQPGWEGAREIFVVANGPLGALPFSMLATDAGFINLDNQILFDRYRSVEWLANKVAIALLPSVSALKTITEKRRKSETKRGVFAGFGDPIFSAQHANDTIIEVASRRISLRASPRTRSVTTADLSQLPQLPDTREELVDIARAVAADLDRDLFLGIDASEQSVKSTDLSNYDVISFATHGLLPGDLNGLNEPALAFSSPALTNSNEDGLLIMSEILSLKLDADLVILSACNTAAAENKGAEAVSGLGRAFFYAGTKALLVSNWPVHSRATSDLMIQMFKRLAKDDSLSRSEALRQARLFQIDQGGFEVEGGKIFSYAHPIFWAPFSLVGDPG